MADLASLAAALRAQGQATFRYGLGIGEPRCTDDGWLGVGLTDLDGRRTRVVGVAVSQQIQRRWETMPASGPINGAGLAIVRRFLRRGAKPQERRYDGLEEARRRAPDAPWRDRPLSDDEGQRKRLVDPTWTLDLLTATPDAVRSLSEAEETEPHVEAVLDPAAVTELVAWGLDLRAHDPRHADHVHELTLHVALSNGLPAQVGVCMSKCRETVQPVWHVLEFTAFGVDPDAVDLWDAWARLSSQG